MKITSKNYILDTIDYKDYLLADVSKSIIRHYFGLLNTDWVDDICATISGANIFGDICMYYYRLVRHIVENKLVPLNSQSLLVFENFIEKLTSNYISPFAILEENVVLDGTHIFIYGDYKINTKTCIMSGVIVGDKHHDDNAYNTLDTDNSIIFPDNKPYIIDKKCIIFQNAKVIFCNIGAECIICENAVVRENIGTRSTVNIVNQCQLTKREKTYIPSQELVVFGLVPKYKNTLTIFGEGIYNPNVIIRFGNKKIESQIEYWDKSKIILKLKGFLEKQNNATSDQNLTLNIDIKKVQKNTNNDKCIVVVMSRGTKVTINDTNVVKKLLKNI